MSLVALLKCRAPPSYAWQPPIGPISQCIDTNRGNGFGIPLRKYKVIWGNNPVDGTRATLGPDCDAGRGDIAGAGGACCIGIRGAQEVEGRKVGGMAKWSQQTA